ncbi:MAG: DUF3987 domain-containing protein [Prevotella sp.]|nr:DUF3987 domain-containing protein [Prevotella sp.]
MTSEQVDSLLSEGWLKEMITNIRSGNRKLKDRLPFACPHYARFRNNHRAQKDIIPEAFTFMTCVDVDDEQLVEKATESVREVISDDLSEWHDMVLRMAYSARRKLHIWLRLPVGRTIQETQEDFCKEIGIPYDESCITPERFIYLTGRDEEIYRSPQWLRPLSDEEIDERREAYLNRGLDVDGRKVNPNLNLNLNPDLDGAGSKGADERTRFIAKGVMKEKGLEPSDFVNEGGRHTAVKILLSGAAQLLTRDEANAVLAEMMPEHWKDRNIQQLVKDFYKNYTNPNQRLLKFQEQLFTQSQRLANANLEPTSATSDLNPEASAEDLKSLNHLRRMSKKLPIGLKESLIGVPVKMHMPVLCAVMPIAAAYADQVEVEYCDGTRQHLGLMSIIRGEQASGKSVCKNAVDVWKRQLEEEDALARKREEEWKEKKKARKANEKAPDDPKVLIRAVPVTVSCSTLLKRMKNSHGHTLYSFGEELDTLRKTNGAGSWSSKYDIYRMAFDRGEWGQDYNSDQAESGMVNVAYNWTMLGTDGAMKKCFKQDNIENGLSSRILVSEMPDTSFAKMPKYGKRSSMEEERIQEAVTRLRSITGFIDTPRLRKAMEKWVEEKRVEAAKDIDHVKDTYRKLAAVIGFRCGVIHYLLSAPLNPHCRENENPKVQEGPSSVQFAVMMAQYCLDEQLKAFGNTLRQEYIDAQSECQRYGANHSVFDQLPPVFTLDDLGALKRRDLSRKSIQRIVLRWRNDGWVEQVDKMHWEKKATKRQSDKATIRRYNHGKTE